MIKLKILFAIVFWCIIVGCLSCGNPKQLQYIQGSLDSASLKNALVSEPSIQKGDLLSIVVFSDNSAASKPFNQELFTSPDMTSSGISNMQGATMAKQAPNYLVDNGGDILFPVLGKLKVEGLTKSELGNLLDDKLSKYLTNAYTDIRFLNFKISMIGEVTKPGVYSIPNERINLLEAIGLAGDLTFFGKRDNVLIVREVNGKREFGRVDLRDPSLFRSEYFHLKQNDIVIVDMSKRKVAANDQVAVRNISLAAGIISAIAVLLSVLK